jgi:glycine/D-amino acid oxidase-like deaminating enzyme
MQHACLWLAAVDGDESPPLDSAVSADVCVVGGGYTGLWTALRVLELEPAARVVLVEAERCGFAASGRNGGFALSWWPKLPTLVKRVGAEEAVRLARASAGAVGEIGSFCSREGVDAHFRRGGWLWTAGSDAQLGAWDDALTACARAGVEAFEPLGADALLARTGSGVHRAGVFESGAATVQPALLARGLRRVAIERGVRVHERSPMVALDRDAGVVRTPRGSVRAGAVVLAANAWLAGVRELRRSIAVVSSDVVASEPIADALGASGWTGGEAISDSRMMVRYLRTTADGRVVLGRGGGALAYGARGLSGFHDPPSSRLDPVAAELPRLVPAARGARVTHGWGGAVDRSVDGLPFFGRLPVRARVVYGAGYSGNGVGPSFVGGRVLASLALGREDEWSGCGLARGVPARFPPDPVRFLGGLAVRRAVGRKERLETDGGSAGPVVRGLAALAPKGR